MDYIISIAIGLATSFLGGILFLLFFLKQLVPKIVISEHISKVKREGKTSYEFKFVNHTKSGIFDVRIEPVFYKPYGDIEGMNLKSTDIKLVDNFMSSISKKSKIDKNNMHAQRVSTLDNLEAKWTDKSSFIKLTIISKHSLSGLNRVYSKEFYSVDCITKKQFVSGDSLKVV